MNKIIINEIESSLNTILLKENPKSILLITGNKSYKKSIAENYFNTILSRFSIKIYKKNKKNCCFNEINTFLKKVKKIKFDIIIAYGGGSVIDFSKIIALFKNNIILFNSSFLDTNHVLNKTPIVAIPTTAGSGAESTQFAVIYKKNIKFSILNKTIIPKYAILDVKTTLSLSKHQIASSSIDALCQSIESLWAKNKNEKSEEYALQSLKLIYPNIIDSFKGKEKNRSLMLIGSNLSGKAINISKTTAPHAMSYYLSAFHNIPHGEAVAINLEPFIKLNFNYIRDKVKTKLLKIFEVNTKNEFIKCIQNIKFKLGLKSNLSEIKNLNLEQYLSYINLERLKNNPIEINKKIIRNIISNSFYK